LQKIKENLEQKKLEIAKGMIEGRISDFESYHKHVGIAEGLTQASEIIDDTMKKLDKEDE
jgi:CRISPR/Cas system-associated endonuclease Cas1